MTLGETSMTGMAFMGCSDGEEGQKSGESRELHGVFSLNGM